jgi:hypothetical protein
MKATKLEAPMTSRVLSLSVTLFMAVAGAAESAPGGVGFVVPAGGFVLDGGDIEVAALTAPPSLMASASAQSSDPQAPLTPRPRAFEYSDGYRIRLKIHKYASFATLPLFAAQVAVGQKLYNNPSDGTRSAHGALVASTAVLFGVNSVTGVWNFAEGRKDPNHRTKRMVHGILMLVADAGFVATGMLAPDDDEGGGNRSTHRTVALASMGVATVAYLMMLIH